MFSYFLSQSPNKEQSSRRIANRNPHNSIYPDNWALFYVSHSGQPCYVQFPCFGVSERGCARACAIWARDCRQTGNCTVFWMNILLRLLRNCDRIFILVLFSFWPSFYEWKMKFTADNWITWDLISCCTYVYYSTSPPKQQRVRHEFPGD